MNCIYLFLCSAKVDNRPISVGVFTIYPVSGEVQLSETGTVHIECNVETEGSYSEVMNVIVNKII